MTVSDDAVRVDKWLWAARFFKTRSLAAEAVSGGKVHVNGQRIKPARRVHTGDSLRIRRAGTEFVVTVRAVSERRGPAREAQVLYEETEESARKRADETAARKARHASTPSPDRRPSKRERREIMRLRRR